jgi:GntR family transcriptional repressor for pyruvate dehydrogenase complex
MKRSILPAGHAAKDDITNQLIGRLKDLISNGVLSPGAKLPPERELCVAFGVSRSSLRHALKALEIMGVLRQRVGDGTYLTESSEGVLREPLKLLMLMDSISLEDLLETRLIVEPELAARAAERATLEDLARMRESLENMKRWKQEEKLIEADLAFHGAIFLAARNPICSRIFSLLHQSMTASIDVTSKLVDWDHTLAFHRPIYAAIERRRPAEAREKMIEHLSDARSLLARVSAQSKKLDLAAAILPVPGTARAARSRRGVSRQGRTNRRRKGVMGTVEGD